jgi:hypothetical protein
VGAAQAAVLGLVAGAGLMVWMWAWRQAYKQGIVHGRCCGQQSKNLPV